MWIMGMMTYLLPRVLHRPWASVRLCELHYWLSTVGILVMAGDLILLGLFQGWSWAALEPWDVSVEFSQPFWVLRILAGLSMFGGLLAFLTNIWLTLRSPVVPAVEVSLQPVVAEVLVVFYGQRSCVVCEPES